MIDPSSFDLEDSLALPQLNQARMRVSILIRILSIANRVIRLTAQNALLHEEINFARGQT